MTHAIVEVSFEISKVKRIRRSDQVVWLQESAGVILASASISCSCSSRPCTVQ